MTIKRFREYVFATMLWLIVVGLLVLGAIATSASW